MSRVIQIRDVPEEVHATLRETAREQGLSLTRFLQDELAQVARRAETVRHNAVVVRRTQSRVGRGVDRATIRESLMQDRDG